jgi:Putative zinc-finger
MNCEEIKSVMPRYLAGESDQAEAVAVEQHLENCQQCAADLEADRQVDATLREAMLQLEVEPDASAIVSRVRRIVAHEEHVPWFSALTARRTFSLGPLRFAAASALLVLVLALGRGMYVHQMEKGIAMAAAHDHYKELVMHKPADWVYSGEPSARFMQTNFPGNPDLVRSITPAGGAFEKVRICNLKGTHYAHFVFRTAEGEVSVFLRSRVPGEHPYTPESVHDRSNGLEVAGFSSPTFVGAVVGQDGHVPAGAIAAQTARAL